MIFSLPWDGVENVCAESVDGGVGPESGHARVVTGEERGEIIEVLRARGGTLGIHETFSVEPVGIDQTGIEHFDPKPKFEVAFLVQEIGQERPHVLGRLKRDTLWLFGLAEVGGQ